MDEYVASLRKIHAIAWGRVPGSKSTAIYSIERVLTSKEEYK